MTLAVLLAQLLCRWWKETMMMMIMISSGKEGEIFDAPREIMKGLYQGMCGGSCCETYHYPDAERIAHRGGWMDVR